MDDYYSKHLSAERLRLCYEIAPPRVVQYLNAEIDFVLNKIKPSDKVLELGCGYGRILLKLAAKAKTVVGIDNSGESILLAKDILKDFKNCQVFEMDDKKLDFPDNYFDKVLCLQNGLSAFKLNKRNLIKETLRVTRIGGSSFFSSYSNNFWEDRLGWFRLQVECGLLGEIDEDKTKDGVIICKDGFRATTITEGKFRNFCEKLNLIPKITEVDKSSIFWEIIKN
ncbi:MAG: methyltransferase domain-containing protein [Ignavibacteria bacterium]|nr:methyltransferase domain-containing protein [Ignavibacteria bacterium]